MNRVCDMLGIKYPIVQGAMQGIATAKLAATVSNAGGLGVIATARKNPTEVRHEIQLAKKITNKPFAVNLMLMDENVPDVVRVVIDEKIKVVTTGAGTPKPYMKELKAAGVKVLPVVPNVKIAKKMEKLGVAGVIAEGMEAGAHVGSVTSLVLWPQVADAISIPMIAAGGIGDGRGMAMAFLAGAEGIQCGTIFSIAKESPVGNNWRNAIINANDTSAALVGTTIKGGAVRGIVNKASEKLSELEKANVSRDKFNAQLNKDSQIALDEDNPTQGFFMAGEVSGMITESKPVTQIISDLIKDTQQVLNKQVDFI